MVIMTDSDHHHFISTKVIYGDVPFMALTLMHIWGRSLTITISYTKNDF